MNSMSRGRERTDSIKASCWLDRRRAEIEHALACSVGQPASEFAVKELPLDASTLPPNSVGLPGDLLERVPTLPSRVCWRLECTHRRCQSAFFPVVRLTGAAGFESLDVESLFNWRAGLEHRPSITLPLFQEDEIAPI